MLISAWERIASIFLYLIPWSQAIPFGNILFNQYPFLQIIIIPTIPIKIIQTLIPFGNLLLFLIIFFGVIRNEKLAYFIRFNALQSLLLNIGIILFSFIFQIFLNPFYQSLFVRTLTTTVFVSILSIITFSISECIKGKEPDLPGISTSVRMQL